MTLLVPAISLECMSDSKPLVEVGEIFLQAHQVTWHMPSSCPGPLGRGPTCVAGDETAPWEVERNATLCEVLPLPLEGPKHLQAVRLLCQCCLPRHLWLFCAECSPPWTYLPFHPAAHPGFHNPHLAFAHLEWKVPHLCCWYPSRACGGCLVPALCSFSLEEPEPSS